MHHLRPAFFPFSNGCYWHFQLLEGVYKWADFKQETDKMGTQFLHHLPLHTDKVKGKDIVLDLSLSHLRNKPHILEHWCLILVLPFLEYFLVGNDSNNNQLYVLVCYVGKKRRIILLQVHHNKYMQKADMHDFQKQFSLGRTAGCYDQIQSSQTLTFFFCGVIRVV